MNITTGKEQRINAVSKIEKIIERSKSIVFADYHGLSSDQMNDLRSKLKENNSDASVSKNSLLKIALKNKRLGGSPIDGFLKGPTLAIHSFEDTLAGVKTLFKYAKENEALKIKAGLIDGDFVESDQLKILSQLPSKEELLTKVTYGLKSPIVSFVNIFSGSQRKFVYALSAIAKAKTETTDTKEVQ